MKVQTNAIIQTIGVALQGVNVAALPPGYQLWVALALGALQGAIGVLAHYRNPDGTPAKKEGA